MQNAVLLGFIFLQRPNTSLMHILDSLEITITVLIKLNQMTRTIEMSQVEGSLYQGALKKTALKIDHKAFGF